MYLHDEVHEKDVLRRYVDGLEAEPCLMRPSAAVSAGSCFLHEPFIIITEQFNSTHQRPPAI
jgi:hypothetical protein